MMFPEPLDLMQTSLDWTCNPWMACAMVQVTKKSINESNQAYLNDLGSKSQIDLDLKLSKSISRS